MCNYLGEKIVPKVMYFISIGYIFFYMYLFPFLSCYMYFSILSLYFTSWNFLKKSATRNRILSHMDIRYELLFFIKKSVLYVCFMWFYELQFSNKCATLIDILLEKSATPSHFRYELHFFSKNMQLANSIQYKLHVL